MAWPKGKKRGEKTPGSGKKKGTPNKFTGEIKEMVLNALGEAGGVDYLVKQAEQTPTAFLALVGKVIPLQVAGPNGGPIPHLLEVRIVDSAH